MRFDEDEVDSLRAERSGTDVARDGDEDEEAKVIKRCRFKGEISVARAQRQ